MAVASELGCVCVRCVCVGGGVAPPAPVPLSHQLLPSNFSSHISQANHRRRLHQEALARARKAAERKARWAAASARGAGAVEAAGVEAGAAV